MKWLIEKMNLIKAILKELGYAPLCRTELEQRVVLKAGSHATFEDIIRYLTHAGYIQKSTPKHRANYQITPKGTKLLEALL
ncbi:MAG: winged helix-turn-helix domain-containing protein [Candidatus Bathyarchaeota archaeon]|nr:winged helix-turn-helix domain-containing protein [Candidatus Bathyarchaeota archaeon]